MNNLHDGAGFSERYAAAQNESRGAEYMKSVEQIERENRRELAILKAQINKKVEEMVTLEGDKALVPAIVPMPDLRDSVLYDVGKTTRYQELPCFLVFLTVCILSTVLQLLADQKNSYYTVDAVAIISKKNDFVAADEWPEWWDWLGNSVTNISKLVPLSVQQTQVVGPGLPLGFLHVRQWRVSHHNCAVQDYLPSSARDVLEDMSCINTWSSSTAARNVFGSVISDPFRPDSHFEYPLRGDDIAGKITNYPKDITYSVYINLKNLNGTIEEDVLDLRRRGFIDEYTSAVSVEVIGYMPSREQFYAASFIMEASPTGSLIQTTTEKLFRSFRWEGDRDYLIFVFDITILLYLALFINQFRTSFMFSLKTVKNWVEVVFNFWRIFDVIFIIVWFLTMYYRFSLWNEASESSSNTFIPNHAKDYNILSADAEDRASQKYLRRLLQFYDGSLRWQGSAVLLTCFRLLAFLQCTDRLGIATRTISAMAQGFFVMCGLFLVTMVGFAFAGTLIYSSDFHSFSTFGRSMSLILRFVFTQELTCKRGGPCVSFNDMTKTAALETTIYLSLIMIIGFIVFLSLLVALVMGNLESVLNGSRGQGKVDWGPAALWQEFIKASRRMNPQWLTELYSTITEKLFWRQKDLEEETNNIGDRVTAGELKKRDEIVVRNKRDLDWTRATVVDIIRNDRHSTVVYVRIAGSSQYRDTREWEEMHRFINVESNSYKQKAMDPDMYIALLAYMDAHPPTKTFEKSDWISFTSSHIPPTTAIKLFDFASDLSPEKAEEQRGILFAQQLAQRIEKMAKVLSGRSKLDRVPFLGIQDAFKFTKKLIPVADKLHPSFSETSIRVRQLRQSLTGQFDDLTLQYSKEMANVSNAHTRMGDTLHNINRQL